MRCLDCRAQFKQKEIKSTGRHCPSCGHEIAAMPREDGISDGKIARLMRKLQTPEQIPVYPEHLAYAMAMERSSGSKKVGWLIAAVLLAIGIFALQFWLIPIALIAAWLVWRHKGKDGFERNLELARAFGRINLAFPGDNGEIDATRLDAALGAGAGQVLVCSSPRFVEYLHAASFPLHNTCPVLGPRLEELSLYPGLEQRLRNDPQLAIIVVSDYTPAGLAFKAGLPGPLAEHPNVHHVGLTQDQVRQLGEAARPMDGYPGKDSRAAKEAGKQAAELFAFKPSLLLPALAVALTTLALVLPTEAAAAQSQGEYDDDSE